MMKIAVCCPYFEHSLIESIVEEIQPWTDVVHLWALDRIVPAVEGLTRGGAISSGSINRPKVEAPAILSRTSGSSPTWALSISVLVKPGQIQAVCIPVPARSWQVARIIPMTACLVVT